LIREHEEAGRTEKDVGVSGYTIKPRGGGSHVDGRAMVRRRRRTHVKAQWSWTGFVAAVTPIAKREKTLWGGMTPVTRKERKGWDKVKKRYGYSPLC